MLGIGAVLVGAGLLPAVTANSGGTTTISGDVETVDGEPLAFFPVGFWVQSDGATGAARAVRTTVTDASGAFTLDVSDTIDGYAYAGTVPDSTHAILEHDGRQIVRGVITGARAATPTYPIYQGRPTSTAKGLDGGAAQVHFRLQEAGRIAGTSPVPASELRAIQVRRADNSVVETLHLDRRSRFRSRLLVPGQYGVVLVPKSPGLPTVANAIVKSGTATTVELPRPVAGATVLGTVRTPMRPAGAGVPVLLERDGAVLAVATTDTTGDWSISGVAAGTYAVEVGRFDEPASTGAAAMTTDVHIPGASPSPTPTASTASPPPPTQASSPENAAIEPVERTSDEVLPQSFTVDVPDVLGEVNVNTLLEPAARVAGRVTVTSGTGAATPIRVLAELPATGQIVRAINTDANGNYALGGLEPGQRYRIYAVTEPQDGSLAQMGITAATASTKATATDLVVDRSALTLTGTVADAHGGRVALGDAQLLNRSSTIDASGTYRLQGLIPGAYPVVVTTPDRKPSTPLGVVVSESQTALDLRPGPKPATFKGWFINTGAGVPAIAGTATAANGDQVKFGPTTNHGHVTIRGLNPGTYQYDANSFRGSAPTVDGPWYYQAPLGTFSLSDNATTDVLAIVLHVKTH